MKFLLAAFSLFLFSCGNPLGKSPSAASNFHPGAPSSPVVPTGPAAAPPPGGLRAGAGVMRATGLLNSVDANFSAPSASIHASGVKVDGQLRVAN